MTIGKIIFTFLSVYIHMHMILGRQFRKFTF